MQPINMQQHPLAGVTVVLVPGDLYQKCRELGAVSLAAQFPNASTQGSHSQAPHSCLG